MPYISAEEVKIKRNLIKKAFPSKDGWKISVRTRNNSTICATIKAGPIKMLNDGKSHEQVNHFYIKEHYNDNPEVKNVLMKLYEIMNKSNGTLTVDGDYGAVPNFYTDISIGDWESPYVKVNKK